MVIQNAFNLLKKYFKIWEVVDDKVIALSLAKEVVHPDFKGRFNSNLTGPENMLEIARNRNKAFKNPKFIIDYDKVYFDELDQLVVPYIFTGIYKGTFLPKEAVGKKVEMDGLGYYKIKDGKLLGIKSTRNEDLMFKQLGVTRPEGETNEF